MAIETRKVTDGGPIESWRVVFRDGFLPCLPTEGLLAVARAMAADDETLVQGKTTVPPPIRMVADWPCEAADLIAFGGWKGGGLQTVGEVEEFFARACFDADQRIGEPAACRWLLNYWDDSPRVEAFREVYSEVLAVLVARGADVSDLPDALPGGPVYATPRVDCEMPF